MSHTRCAVISAALAVLCYWNSLQCGLVHDDIFAIRDNPDVRPETPLTRVFSNDFWGKPMSSNISHKSFRPLTVLSFRLNYALHALEPWGYHLVNVGLHVMATLMVGWMTRRLAFPETHLTFLVMCLFASHPVHSEAVTGVVGRAELLSCICFILSLLSFTSSLSSTSTRQQTLSMMCISMLMGGVAMLFKETGATVFGVCLAYDLLIHSHQLIFRIFVKSKENVFPALVPFLLRSFSLLLTSSFLLYLRISLLHGHLPHFSDHDNPASHSSSLLTRSLTYSYLFFFNTRLLVYPLTLCYDWQMGSIPLIETLSDSRNFGTFVFFSFFFSLLVYSLVGLHRQQRSARVVALSLLLMVIPFLPASNLLFRVGFVVAERVLYIPSIGYYILLVQGIKTLSVRLCSLMPRPLSSSQFLSSSPSPTRPPPPHLSSKLLPTTMFLLCLLLVGLFSVRTIVRNPVWLSRESLFKSGLATIPHNAKIHYNYANYLSDTNRLEEATHHYRLAIQLAPDHASSHNNLASLVGTEEAEFHFRQAVLYNPTHYKAFYNLGNNLLNQGRVEEAEQALRESLRINGDYHGSLMTLATILSDSGRIREGLRLMEQAVGVAPEDPLVRNNMAAFFVKEGRVEEAIKEYHYSLSLDPNQTTVMINLGRSYRSHGETTIAEKWFLKSLEVKEDVSAYSALGALYFNTGRFSKAKQTFSRALAIHPLHLKSHCSYLRSMVELGETAEAEAEALSVLNNYTNPDCLHLILAIVYLKNGQELEKVVHHSTKAQSSQDSQVAAEASIILGGAYKSMGEMDKSEMSYRRAVTLAPDMVIAHINLGVLLHLREEYTEARYHYEKALSLDPGNKLVIKNLSKLNRADTS